MQEKYNNDTLINIVELNETLAYKQSKNTVKKNCDRIYLLVGQTPCFC
jgi:hypothetical protein